MASGLRDVALLTAFPSWSLGPRTRPPSAPSILRSRLLGTCSAQPDAALPQLTRRFPEWWVLLPSAAWL